MSTHDDLPQRDPALERAWREHSREMPPPALDNAILAAAHRAAGSRPQAALPAEATSPQRWWMPIAAAATIGAVVISIMQTMPADTNLVTSDVAPTARVATLTPAPARNEAVSAPAKSARDAAATAASKPDAAPATSPPAAPAARATAAEPKSPPPMPVPAPLAQKAAPAASPVTPPVAADTDVAPARKREAANSERAPRAMAPPPPPASPAPAPMPAPLPGSTMHAPEPFPAASPPPTVAPAPEGARAQTAEQGRANDAASRLAETDARKDAPAERRQAPAAPPAAAPALAGRMMQAPMPASSAATAARDERGAAAAARPLAKTTANQDAQTKARDPDAWIARIRKLRDEGNTADALRELREFRDTVPDAERRLPADLREWAAAVRP
jgi:resuscitation-promoting factor RpfA